ncbi:MAG TPA: ABC transporter substrate-binding protein [Chloroflexota bacterium]
MAIDPESRASIPGVTKLSRRQLLKLLGVGFSATLAAACQPDAPAPAPPVSAPAATTAPASAAAPAATSAPAPASPAAQQAKPLRIGVIYDYTGPFAAGGSVAAATGTQIAIDMTNEKGGVQGKYKVEAITADAQSKADVAINEAERLLNAEKVDALVGIYSSAHAVPLAPKVDQEKKFLWLGLPSAADVLRGKNLQYVFRCIPYSDLIGGLTPKFLAEFSPKKLNIAPKDLKIAIIYEDGPYGTGMAVAIENEAKTQGLQIVHKEAYSATAPDLSALVTKLRRAQPDVLMHTAYNPDITLFLRQAREQGLKFRAVIGHGAGYSQIDKLRETFKSDVDYFFNSDVPFVQLFDPAKLAPGVGDLAKEFVKRYAEKTKDTYPSPQAGAGFNNTWLFLNNLVPAALQKYGDWSAESLRKAALEMDIPVGGTVDGYGIKFAPPGDPMAGQNIRAFPTLEQYLPDKTVVVYPTEVAGADPVLPLPKSNPYAM